MSWGFSGDGVRNDGGNVVRERMKEEEGDRN